MGAKPSTDGAYWLVLLEKAFAKLYINYANLDGGLPAEALRTLTGMPVMTYRSGTQKSDVLFKAIQDAD